MALDFKGDALRQKQQATWAAGDYQKIAALVTGEVEWLVERMDLDAGARVLAPFLPPVVIDCVRHHVAAKRYLCATRPDYYARLSTASIHSLNLQGGPMTKAEAADFARNPNLQAIIAVRYLDEAGKRPDMETPDFAHFAPMVQRMVDRHCA